MMLMGADILVIIQYRIASYDLVNVRMSNSNNVTNTLNERRTAHTDITSLILGLWDYMARGSRSTAEGGGGGDDRQIKKKKSSGVSTRNHVRKLFDPPLRCRRQALKVVP